MTLYATAVTLLRNRSIVANWIVPKRAFPSNHPSAALKRHAGRGGAQRSIDAALRSAQVRGLVWRSPKHKSTSASSQRAIDSKPAFHAGDAGCLDAVVCPQLADCLGQVVPS